MIPSLSVEGAQVHPLLIGVTDKLWAEGKYDVDLVRTAEPVVIIPKSD